MKLREYMSLLSRYRTPIMGICILNVVFGHTGMFFLGPLNYILNCYWIIDIFFFFSGMGAYHSLTKNDNTLEFYKRRFMRIYLPYFPVILIYCAEIFIWYGSAYSGFELVKQALGNVLLLGWLAGLDNQLNWYPQAIMVVYLMTPALFAAIKSFRGDRRKMALLLGFFALGQLCFLGTTYLVAVSRILSFLLGLLAAELAAEDADIRLNVPVLIITAVIGHVLAYLGQRCDTDIIWQYGVSWYPALLAIPGTMLLTAWLMKFISEKKWLGWLSWLFNISGRYSFEIFLVHLIVYSILPYTRLYPHSNSGWVPAAVFSVVISIPYGKLIDAVRGKLTGK